jgi:hypothetical protein
MLVAIRRKGRFSSLLSSHGRVTLLPRRDVSPSPSTTAPSAAPSTATADQPHDEEQQYRANGSVYDRADDAVAKMDAKPSQQPTTDKGPKDTDNQVTDDPESGPAHDLTGQPAGDETYEQYYQEAFARHTHFWYLNR